jgi:hypothetical protein
MRATIDGPATGWHGGFGSVGARSPGTLPPPCGSRSYHTGEESILGLRPTPLRADSSVVLRTVPRPALSFSIPEPS